MADVVVHKRQAVIDRLKRRMEGYRRHNQDCVPRYSNAFAEQQNVQETLMLKQKYMETKSKRNVKKNDKKPIENGNTMSKFGVKRPSSEDLEGQDGGPYGNHDGLPPPPKCVPLPGNNSQQSSPHSNKNDNSNNAKFSVKIVQELEFSTSEHQHNAQISTNLTLTSVNTSVQSDVTTKQSPTAAGAVPTTVGPSDPMECKQEQPDLMDFPGDGDLNDLSFINNDTNEPMLAVDTDTLTEIISDLNSEGITPADFNQVGLCDKRPIKTEPDPRCTPPVKSPFDQQPQQQQQQQQQQRGSGGNGNGNNNYSNCVAAETLKQLAEQHNNQQRPEKCGYDFPYQSPGSVPDFIHSPSTPVGTPNPGYNMMSPVNSMYHQEKQQQQENNNYYQEPPKPRIKQPAAPAASRQKQPLPQQQQQQQQPPQQQPQPSPQSRYNQFNGHGSPQYPVGARRITPSPGAASGVLSPQPNVASPDVTTFQMSQSQQVHVSQQGQQQSFGQGPGIQDRLIGASVTSSAAPNCGGPMQYYNSNCADSGQQSYMHMSQSQSVTFSQQRARLLTAGASPTNIRPPTSVQQQSNMTNEHHMLPQHMNRTPMNMMNGPGACRPPPPEYKLNVAQNMGMCQTPQYAAQGGYIPPARQPMLQGAQTRRPMQQQPIPPSGPMLRSQMANTGGGGNASPMASGYDRMPSVQRNMMYPSGGNNLQRPPNVTPSTEAFNSDWQQLLAARQQQQQQQQHQQQQQFRPAFTQASMGNVNQASNAGPVNNIVGGFGGNNPNMNSCQTGGPGSVHLMAGQMQHMSARMGNAQQALAQQQQQHANINMQSQNNQMSVNLQMSQTMGIKMGAGAPGRMAGNQGQMITQQQQQHHHQQQQQQQQPQPQQHQSMIRTQQQQSFAQQQTAINNGNPYQRNMAASNYSTSSHQQFPQTSASMQPTPVTGQSAMLNTNTGLPPRNTFSPSDFNFDFLDQPLANDSKNGFNNKQQTFGDFNFDFLDAH